MKRVIIILIATVLATTIGLYFRPSFFLVGQLNWFNVLTKGYFVGSFSAFFSQGLLDESFYFVMRFTVAGLLAGIAMAFMTNRPAAKKSRAKAKKK